MSDAGDSTGNVMAVKTELVKEFVVNRIESVVVERERDHLAPTTESLLDVPLAEISGNAASGLDPVTARQLARAGYLARLAERELFEPTRLPVSTWAHELGRGADASEPARAVSARLARLEPVDRPNPDDEGATTWRVPGPGWTRPTLRRAGGDRPRHSESRFGPQ